MIMITLQFTKVLPRPSIALAIAASLIFGSPVMAVDDTASFTGSVTTPPQVDATNFYNSATWNISTIPLPFRTAHTLNYYNKSTMTAGVGWDFGWAPSLVGSRGPSSTFTNDNNGIITATDTGSYGSFLLVNATNIVNKGQLIAGNEGVIRLSGYNVQLGRSQLQIQPVGGGRRLYLNQANQFYQLRWYL